MKYSSRKNPRKAPVSPEAEKPFFQGDRPPNTPFFNTSNIAPIQPKLTIGKPNDVYEQEADAVASSVVNQSNKASVSPDSDSHINRQAMEEETAQTKPELMQMEQEEEVQTQPKLMRMEQEEETVQTQEEEEPVQTKVDSGQPAQPPAQPDLSQRLNNTKGQGNPLPAQTQTEMSQLFNYDFSDVTIHTGADAVQMTQELKAQAFTHGKDIYFNEGKYNPETSSGKQLLAHELTHVVQQNSAQSAKL
jgi:hypothetical protein